MSRINPEILAGMSRREVYFSDLSTVEKEILISEVPAEYEELGLSGESTGALIGGVYGYFKSGARSVLKHNPNKTDIFELDDGIHEVLITDIGKMTKRFEDNDTSASTFFYGRAASTAAKQANAKGMPNVSYKTGAKTYNIFKILNETNDSQWEGLSEEDFHNAVYRSGTPSKDADSLLARNVWRMSDTDQIQIEHPSDEEIVAHRLDVDSDTSDDELISPSSIVVDRNSDAYSDSDDRLDAAAVINGLPWDLLNDRQVSVVRRISDGETLQSISEDLGISRERVRQINLKAVSVLRSKLSEEALLILL